MQNGPFQGVIFLYILYYWIIITDALTCEQHFKLVKVKAISSIHTLLSGFIYNNVFIFYSEICFVYKILTCKVTGKYSCQINIVELQEHVVIWNLMVVLPYRSIIFLKKSTKVQVFQNYTLYH